MAALTKKHFQAVADILCETGASKKTVEGFSAYFKSENPRFNTARFEKAVASCKRDKGLGSANGRRAVRRRVRRANGRRRAY